jgi:hypothetical protein
MLPMGKVSAGNPMRLSGIMGAVLVTLLLFTGKGGASGIDLHWLWDNQCAECHGHSGVFARKFLQVANGELQGNHHVQGLRLFMRNHYTQNTETDAVYEMLLAQASAKPRFKQECGNCHGGAAAFVRHSVILQDDVLLSRESGQPIQKFLQQHRQLGADDVVFFTSLLNRIAGEVFRP